MVTLLEHDGKSGGDQLDATNIALQELQTQIDSIPAGDNYNAVTTFYINTQRGSDVTGTGSLGQPYASLGAAFAQAGDAADDAEWNDPDLKFYRFILEGVTTENPTIPLRPFVVIDFRAGQLIGNLDRSMPAIKSTGQGAPRSS